MEAALGGAEGLAPGSSHPPPPQRQLSSGLPPRGPPPPHHHQHRASSASSAALDAALAGASSREPSQAGLLPAGRTSSSSSTPAFLEAVEAEGIVAAVQAAAAHPGAEVASTAASGGSDSGSGSVEAPPVPALGVLPPWQSPARIAPAAATVPPLPLSRLGNSSGARPAGLSAGSEFELLPATSAAAPAGLHPPAPQPALNARQRSGSGVLVLGGRSTAAPAATPPDGSVGGPGTASAPSCGGSSARRPLGLQQLDTQGLTFETFGLESPDTITPGLQYARQVAQLFVEGRRRSHPGGLAASIAGTGSSASSLSSAAAGNNSVASAAAPGHSPCRLGQAPAVPDAGAGGGGGGVESQQQQQHAHRPWRPPNPT